MRFWKCPICGNDKYAVSDGVWNGVIGPGGHMDGTHLECTKCSVHFSDAKHFSANRDLSLAPDPCDFKNVVYGKRSLEDVVDKIESRLRGKGKLSFVASLHVTRDVMRMDFSGLKLGPKLNKKEREKLCWESIANVLREHIPRDRNDWEPWHLEIADIWFGKGVNDGDPVSVG